MISTEYGFTKEGLAEFRKEHYWRGFKVALFITAPVIVALMVAIHYIVMALA